MSSGAQMKITKHIPDNKIAKILLKNSIFSDPDNGSSVLNYFLFDSKDEWKKDGIIDFQDKKYFYGLFLGDSEVEITMSINKERKSTYTMECYKLSLDDKIIYIDSRDADVEFINK